jgi:hypothetical protein
MQSARGPRFATTYDWAGKGHWIRADLHLHTNLSDGSYDATTLVAKAKAQGCDAVAITDHADRKLKAATPEYIAAIHAARAANPGITVVTGLEWNIPPAGGREHASLLLPDDPGDGALMAEFKARFDDYDRIDGQHPKVEDALAWLVDVSRNLPVKPVVVYNHPSRKDESSLGNADDMIRWRSVNDLVIGFEGGPGHQGKPPVGSYEGKETPIDRWDPVVAKVGGAWDTLLQKGFDVSGAIASSDFHNDIPTDLNDFLPCAFAETWYYVPDGTVDGLLRAMRAGAFFGVHGHIVRNLELSALVEGLSRPAMAGEAVQVDVGTEIPVVLSFDVPPFDYQEQPNHVDTVEFVVITPETIESRAHHVTGTRSQSVTERVRIGSGGAVVRARVRRDMPDGTALMAYTNAVRIYSR